jgi:hypothetical protein
MQLIAKDITMRGFVYIRTLPKYLEEFNATIPEQVATGKIKYQEEVTHGLDKVGDVLLGVLQGNNKAKAIIHVADE